MRLERCADAESAYGYLEYCRWPLGVRCPVCQLETPIQVRLGQCGRHHTTYRCLACRHLFTVRTGTIFEKSHVPLHRWLDVLYLLATDRPFRRNHLSVELGVTEKTLRWMIRRLRQAGGVWLPRRCRPRPSPDQTLDAVLDHILAYRPPSRSKQAWRRTRDRNQRIRSAWGVVPSAVRSRQLQRLSLYAIPVSAAD